MLAIERQMHPYTDTIPNSGYGPPFEVAAEGVPLTKKYIS